MPKRNWKKVSCIACASILAGSMLAGCGSNSDPNTITFWYAGTEKQQQLYVAYAKKFNEW